MSVSLLQSSEKEAVFHIEIGADDLESAIMEEYKEAVKDQKQESMGLPLSNRVLLNQYPDVDQLAKQALDKILPNYYLKAIKALDLRPMTFPEVTPQETKLGEPCIVEVKVALEPKITLQSFEGLKASYSPVVTTEEDVRDQIKGMKKQRGVGDSDEELLKSLPFETIDEFSAEIRDSLQKLAQEKTEFNKKEAVIKQLIESNDCPLSEEIVEQQILVQINQFTQRVGPKAMQDYMKSTGRTIEDVKKEVRPEAEEAVKKNLLLTAVADTIKPEVTEDDIKNAISQQQNSIMDVGLGYEQKRQQLENTPGAMEQLEHGIRIEKASNYIVSKAVLTETEPLRVLDQIPDALK